MEEEMKCTGAAEEAAAKTLAEYNSIIKKFDEVYKNIARTFGMSDSAFWILYTIRENENPVTQSEICSTIYQPRQTVNSALKKLEREGIVELRAGRDRRSKVVGFTPAGERLAEKTVDCVLFAERRALSGLTQEEQALFMGLFRKYTGLLKESMDEMKRHREAT